MKSKRQEPVKPKQALQEAIGFTLEDLQINESGILSLFQRQILKQDCVRWFLFNLALAALYVFTYIGFQSGAKTYNDIGSLILLYFLALPFFLLTLNNWIRRLLDFLSGKAALVEGNIQLDVPTDRKTGSRYELNIQSVRFRLTKHIFLAFKNNEPYRIYFASYSKTIVSAEWLHYFDH